MDAPVPQTRHLVYTPLVLSTKQIRLLRILDGEDPSRICCTLKTYDDVAAAPYIALSYTWGSEIDSQIVFINGVEFRVRRNLFDFLGTARRSWDESLFWIDQICIDQGNVRERNHQVALMSEIYSKAHSVTAWLGAAGGDSDLAMDLLVELDEINLGSSSLAATAHPSILQNITPRLRNALQELFRRAYWSRLWIVQEIKLAKEVIVRCGTRKVLWKQIISTVGPLCEVSGLGISISHVLMSSRSEIVSPATRTLFMDDRDSGFYKQYGDEDFTLVNAMEYLFGKGGAATHDRTLQLLKSIYMYCEFNCVDVRDKVYGLLGLYDGRTCPVAVDYDKIVLDLYWDVVDIGIGTELIRRRWLSAGSIRLDDLMEAWSYFYVRLSIHMGVDTPDVLRATGETLKATFEALQAARIADNISYTESHRSKPGDSYLWNSFSSLHKSGDISATLGANLESLSAHLKELETKRKWASSWDAVRPETPSSCPDVHMPRFESNTYVGDDVEGFGKEPGALALRTLDFGFTDPNIRHDPNERYVIR